MIDTHTHLHYTGRLPGERPGISAEQLVNTMDQRGIDKSVVLPIESPEIVTGCCTTEQVVAAARMFPERIIPFVQIDPRTPRSDELIEHFVTQFGCKGYGETVDGLPFDDPLKLRIYAKCNELQLPLVFYGSGGSNFDEVGLPRLEKCLQQYPDMYFIGHGPRWWNAISADDDGSCGYPKGPISEGGAADRLLQDYPNMYADISAGSGYNAMTRDAEFTRGFVERNWSKILFATDYLSAGHGMGHVEWVRETPMDEQHRQAIMEGNARTIIKLDY